jgi:hypothetical protein
MMRLPHFPVHFLARETWRPKTAPFAVRMDAAAVYRRTGLGLLPPAGKGSAGRLFRVGRIRLA